MDYIGNLLSSINNFYNEINPATLSGAIDIIVVEQENGDLASSPFHVRFGKLSLLLPQEKKVKKKEGKRSSGTQLSMHTTGVPMGFVGVD
ncbi:hypothetical protein BD560DRAFT_381583 [Blakeslea trispora]|nr:hypothetical protein BD560DRAFT_381583 [Blakeslea trispora]